MFVCSSRNQKNESNGNESVWCTVHGILVDMSQFRQCIECRVDSISTYLFNIQHTNRQTSNERMEFSLFHSFQKLFQELNKFYLRMCLHFVFSISRPLLKWFTLLSFFLPFFYWLLDRKAHTEYQISNSEAIFHISFPHFTFEFALNGVVCCCCCCCRHASFFFHRLFTPWISTRFDRLWKFKIQKIKWIQCSIHDIRVYLIWWFYHVCKCGTRFVNGQWLLRNHLVFGYISIFSQSYMVMRTKVVEPKFNSNGVRC